jgi:putative ubiquitin-RnfH superfamily antitoxin RatB of RatAB toxin-antitoxin module
MGESMLQVVLCWSLAPRHVHEMSLPVREGSTVQDVLEQGVAQFLQETASSDHNALASLACQEPGIWGKKVPWTHVVHAGDRIELYRPLLADPKVARRLRFKRQGKGRTGLFAKRKSGAAAGY